MKTKKEIHTHCKYQKCRKKLPAPSTQVHYCRNKNKCKNAHHYAVTKVKTDFADSVIEITSEAYELKRKLDVLLKTRRIKTMTIDELELMGIDLSSDLIIMLPMDFDEEPYWEFKFENYLFFYFVDEDKVSVWKNKIAS